MNHHKISMFGTALCLLGLGCSDTAVGQTITTSPPLSSGMSFQVQSGGAQAVQTLVISTSIDPTTVIVSVPAGQTWLTVNGTPAGNNLDPNTPASLPVQVNTLGLSQGQVVTANLTIQIANIASSKVTFPVSLTVGTPSLLSANPPNLTFSAVQGNNFGSPNQIAVTVSSAGQALNYNVTPTTTSGGTWLLVTNTSGISTNSSSPGFYASVNAQNLSAGTYNGLITIQSTTTGDSTTIPVTLSVTLGAALNVTPTTLNNFVYQAGSGSGGFMAETQTIMISTSSGSLNYQVTDGTPTGPTPSTSWLGRNVVDVPEPYRSPTTAPCRSNSGSPASS